MGLSLKKQRGSRDTSLLEGPEGRENQGLDEEAGTGCSGTGGPGRELSTEV